MRYPLSLLLLCALLASCDQLGIESTSSVAARKDADGKAIGGACRHAGRAIEDCYSLNKRAEKAAVYAGWREMNDYMRDNQLVSVLPVLTTGGVASMPAREEPVAEASLKPRPRAR
jgi:hypothetical protein